MLIDVNDAATARQEHILNRFDADIAARIFFGGMLHGGMLGQTLGG
ncbi:hypothetical protein [Mesorhizobium sp. LCM 4576]|nr:hypothetical protein [Mesorhizobium sp. LCM 4576]